MQKESKNKWHYRVGSGVVWDSETKKEWQENQTKMLFINKNNPVNNKNFGLIETMLFEDGKIKFLDEHLKRLEKSAKFFNIKFDRSLISSVISNEEALPRCEKSLKKISHYTRDDNESCHFERRGLPRSEKSLKKIIRLELFKNGKLDIKTIDITPSNFTPKKIKISPIILDKHNIFLQHKTNYRPWYKKTAELIKKDLIYDEIFLNQNNEICEGSRTNIFVKILGQLYTPPISCGLLPGILRNELIKTKQCKEKTLKLDDLKNANKIYLGNSVRGLTEIKQPEWN